MVAITHILGSDTLENRIVAVSSGKVTWHARVLHADKIPRFIDGQYTFSDFSPINLALGFGPFIHFWDILKWLPCRVKPLYKRHLILNPLSHHFLKMAISRQAGGWFFLRGEIGFLHLLMTPGTDFALPEVGKKVEISGWPSDVFAIAPNGKREMLIKGAHFNQPSRKCPWVLFEALKLIE